MILRGGFQAVALKLQEASEALCNSDVATCLGDAIRENFRGSGTWGYFVNYEGDANAGNVIYSSDSDLFRAPYTITKAEGTAAEANINFDSAMKVCPRTVYEPEAEATTQGKESAGSGAGASALKLVESAPFSTDITIREALTPGRKIKIIAPGKGSTAYYTESALKKAATDKIFKAGTPMRIDHPTMAEESARPEGSVKDWGAVLSKDAEWIGDHPQGPGLYAEIKTFSEHAQMIEEKGPYAGVSIRANGNAVTEAGRPVIREGVPVLKEFTSAEGVDMVTRAGAGGMFLSESARPAEIPNNEGGAMDAAELQKLQESLATQTAVNARLLERAIRGDARELAQDILRPLTLHEAAKAEVVAGVLRGSVPVKDGELDKEAFKAIVNAEAQRIGQLIATTSGSGAVRGMGTSTAPVVEIDAKEAERRAAHVKKQRDTAVLNFRESFGMTQAAAEAAADRMFGEVA